MKVEEEVTFSQMDEGGRMRMVDVGDKPVTCGKQPPPGLFI